MYEVKPYKIVGANSWAVYKDNYPIYTGLTREQADRMKKSLSKKNRKIINAKIKIFI